MINVPGTHSDGCTYEIRFTLYDRDTIVLEKYVHEYGTVIAKMTIDRKEIPDLVAALQRLGSEKSARA